MAIFPKIQSPCPYQDNLAAIMDGDQCRMCKRQVFDLTAMSDGERVAFFQTCSGEVCVSYSRPVRLAVAGAFAAAALAAPMAAAAREDAAAGVETIEVVVTAGGIHDPGKVEFTRDTDAKAAPDLPVVYDEAKATPPADTAKTATPADKPAPPVSSPAAP